MDRKFGQPVPAPDRVWVREDKYGIDISDVYGVKPDCDAVEYIRADLAPTGAQPGAASTPSQDSQEVREAAGELVEAIKRQNGPVSPAVAMKANALRKALLSQSPKGAAGAWRPCSNCAYGYQEGCTECNGTGKVAVEEDRDPSADTHCALCSAVKTGAPYICPDCYTATPPPGASGAGDQGREWVLAGWLNIASVTVDDGPALVPGEKVRVREVVEAPRGEEGRA